MTRILMLLSFFIALIGGCASRTKGTEKIQTGMDKDQVLEVAGDPKRTYRLNGQDNWVYIYYEGNEEIQKHVAFEDGHVVRILRPTSKAALTRELEAKGSVEEYEKKRAKRSGSSSEGFKTIDGGPQDVNKP